MFSTSTIPMICTTFHQSFNVEICRNSYHTRRFSTNPMFPMRPEPEIPLESKAKPSNDDSFLSRHGGKVALAALGITFGLIYTYYVSGQNRTKVEEEAEKDACIEPFEIQELRYSNQLTLLEYKRIVQETKKLCLNESNANPFDLKCTYADFIVIVQSIINRKIQSGHILDRFILNYIINNTNNHDKSNIKTDNSTDNLLPLDLLLVLLNLTMIENATDRILGLHSICMWNTKLNGYLHENNDGNSNDVIRDQELELNDVTIESVKNILYYLLMTYQIPPEKQVTETGVKYPFKLYRRRNPDDMVELFEKARKKTEKITHLTPEEMNDLITSNQVCAWGECYHGHNNRL
eukprot:gene5969-8223_t